MFLLNLLYLLARNALALIGIDQWHGDQQFSTDSYTGLWQVLYNDSTYGLQLISSEPVATLSLANIQTSNSAFYIPTMKRIWNEYVSILNSFCENYMNSSYAVSARSVGSNPKNPTLETDKYVTLPFSCNGSRETGCLDGDDNYLLDVEAMESAINQNEGGIVSKDYYLASRKVTYYNENTYTFTNRGFGNWTLVYPFSFSFDMWGTEKVSSGARAGVRPVITLKSGIKTNNGDGSSSNAYQLM